MTGTARPRPAALAGRAAWALLAAALAGGGPSAHAQAPTAYRLDPAHTAIHWEVLHMGTSTLRGRFDRLDGTARFDARQQALEVGISVDVASVSTGVPALDRMLRGSTLLDVQNHPQAWFVARQARFEGERPVEIRGEITLRGRSQPLTLTTRRWHCGFNLLWRREVCGGDLEARLSRSAFGMTLAAGLVADEVLLHLSVEAVRTDPGDEAPPAATDSGTTTPP